MQNRRTGTGSPQGFGYSMAEDDQDLRLLERAHAGDREACGALLRRHEPALRAWVRSRLGAKLKARIDPEDVIQETVLKALEALGSFQYQGAGSFPRWLRSIGERVILKAAERERKKPFLSLRHEVEGGEGSPSRRFRRGERLARLESALGGLSREHREVVRLARIEGLPIREIASRMGRTPAAVSMLLSRALRKLKELFGDTESFGLPERRPGSSGAGGAGHGV
jgi:RNA polymerase sigma-70 factor (ECF subfamily)